MTAKKPEKKPWRSERVAVLEASLDDAAGNALAHAMERLREAGALDAYAAPLVMKKGRPAHLLTVLCRPADAERLARIVFEETPALGLRLRKQERLVLPRFSVKVHTPYGSIRVKVSPFGAEPEYEDCAAAARKHGKPLREIQEAVRLAARAKGHT